jgi:hypothetical protein
MTNTFKDVKFALNIRRLRLVFYDLYEGPWPFYESATPVRNLFSQRSVLVGLGLASDTAEAFSSLKSLVIINLLPHSSECFPSLRPLLMRLRKLSIGVLYDDGDAAYDSPYLEPFFEALVEDVLKPCSSIQMLTLNPSVPIGCIPFFDFSQISYSHLTTLALKHVRFDDMGAENSILRHGATLSSLDLTGCGILIQTGELQPERPWAVVWRRFSQTLHALTKLNVFDHDGSNGYKGPYFELDDGVNYFPANVDMFNGILEDKVALGELWNVVKRRSGSG